jgi:hypothetical protein
MMFIIHGTASTLGAEITHIFTVMRVAFWASMLRVGKLTEE